MTSKISSFNIMLEDLRHRIWMLALSCLGSFLAFPVCFLLRNRDFIVRLKYTSPDALQECYVRFFIREAAVTQGIILFFGAMIVGIFGFRYLYSRRMTDLYHSIPVKRSRMFFLTWLTGLLIWLIPMLLFMGITLLLMLFCLAQYGLIGKFGLVILAAIKMIPVFLICFLIVYHFCLVCSMLSGNAFNAVCSSLVLGSGAAAVYGIILLLSSSCFDTYRSLNLSLEQIAWASPLVSAIIMLVDITTNASLSLYSGETYSLLAHPAFFRTGCILLLLLCLAAAYLLYQKRPSELAEHGIDNRFVQGFLRFLTAFLTAQLGALLFMAIAGEESVAWYLFGILLFGTLFYCISNIILHMNFKSFLAHKIQLGAVLVFSSVFLLIFTMDLTGYNTRLPARNRIEKGSLSIGGYQDSSCRYLITENGSLDYDTGTVSWDYRDMESLYPLLEALASSSPNSGICTIDVDLTLKNGSRFSRHYALHKEDLELLRPILESREYLAAYYPASCGLFPAPAMVGISSSLNNIEATTQNQERIQKIMDAYSADFLEHSSMEELENDICVGYLNFTYPYARYGSHDTSFYLDINSSYARTIALLKDYYPEVILDQKALSIVSLEIYSSLALTDPEAEEAASDHPYAEAAETYMEDSEESIIQITDPDQLERLLPYLTLGDGSGNAFYPLQNYKYVGSAALANGNTISCYAKKTDLPLTILLSMGKEEAAP